MRLKEVKNTPRTRNSIGWGNLQKFVKEFEDSDMECAKVEFRKGEYVSAYSCTSAINHCAKRIGANVKAHTVNGETYIMRTIKK